MQTHKPRRTFRRRFESFLRVLHLAFRIPRGLIFRSSTLHHRNGFLCGVKESDPNYNGQNSAQQLFELHDSGGTCAKPQQFTLPLRRESCAPKPWPLEGIQNQLSANCRRTLFQLNKNVLRVHFARLSSMSGHGRFHRLNLTVLFCPASGNAMPVSHHIHIDFFSNLERGD